MAARPSRRWMISATSAVIAHPTLWPTAVRQLRRLTPTGWWRRFPFLPIPDANYLRFRMITAYGGDGTATPRSDDLVTYLEWCRAWPAVTRRQ